MTRVEAQVAPWQSGDGRYFDVVWPEIGEWTVSASWLNAAARHAFAIVPMFSTTGSGTNAFITRGDIPCVRWTSSVGVPGTTKSALMATDWQASPRLRPPGLGGGGPLAFSNTAYTRYYANLAYDVAPAANADVGIGYTAPPNSAAESNGVFNDGLSNAFEWTILADGRPAFCVRAVGGVGLSTFPVLTAPDITKFHCYEIRTVQAGPTTEGTVIALFDGAIHKTLLYGAGTVLPPQDPADPGLCPNLMNNGGNSMNVYIQRMGLSFAPTAPNLQ